MMTIRGKLLVLLLPTLILFVALISLAYTYQLVAVGIALTLALVVIAALFISGSISKPIKRLNQVALDIAEGDHKANIKFDGPQEIVELANTINTMSECLVEHMSRLKESSLIRERMYGEVECAQLLQYYMLEKVVDEFHHPHLRLATAAIPQPRAQRGVLLTIEPKPRDGLHLRLSEAQDSSFTSLYELLRAPATLSRDFLVDCHFENEGKSLQFQTYGLHPPLIWSMKQQCFLPVEKGSIELDHQDMVFFYNTGLREQFGGEEKIMEWLSKVLRHFAEDGLTTLNAMLQNELNFIARKQSLKSNLQLLTVQRQ